MDAFEQALTEGERGVVVDASRGAAPTVVAFGGLGSKMGVPPYEFFRVLDGLPVNRVFVRDLDRAFYQRGVAGLGRGIEEMAENLETMLPSDSAHTLFVGNSAGAYAALIFGSLIPVQHILAISPVTFIGRWRRHAARDRRWRLKLDPVNRGRGAQRDFFDVRAVMRRHPPAALVDVYYPALNRLDTLHARRLEALPRVTLHPVESDRHEVVRMMRDSGALGAAITAALGI